MNHIRDTNTGLSWCQEILNEDFYFKDIEQAAINGLHGNRAMCGHCVDAITRCLELQGKQYNE